LWNPENPQSWHLVAATHGVGAIQARALERELLLAPHNGQYLTEATRLASAAGRWGEVRARAADLTAGTPVERELAEVLLAVVDASDGLFSTALSRLLALLDHQRSRPLGVFDNGDALAWRLASELAHILGRTDELSSRFVDLALPPADPLGRSR
jgi:hypothetical protein